MTIIEVAQNSPVELDLTDDGQIGEALDFLNYHSYTPEYKMPEECSFRVEKVMLKSGRNHISGRFRQFYYICRSERQNQNYQKRVFCRTIDIILIPQELNEFHFIPNSENPVFLRIYMAPGLKRKRILYEL